MSLGGRLFSSSVLNLFEHAVKIAAMFVLTPVLAVAWGSGDDPRWGIWLLLMAFFSYYQLLDLGLSLAAVRFLARSIGRGDRQRTAAVLVTTRVMFGKVALISLAVTAVALALVPLFFQSAERAATARWVIGIYGVGIALKFALLVYTAVLKAHVRYGFIAGTSIVRVLVQTALMYHLLRSGAGLVALAVVLAACEIGQNLVQAIFGREMAGREGRGGRYERGLAREILGYSATSFGTRLSINLKDRIAPFIVGGVIGVKAVEMYSIGTRLLFVVRDVVNALFGGQFLASFSTVDGGGDRSGMRAQLLFSLRLCSAFASFAAIGLLSFGAAFIERWMGAHFVPAYQILAVLAVPFALFMAQYPAFSLMYSVNAHHRLAAVAAIGSALAVVLGIALGMVWGLVGVAAAGAIDLTLVYLVLFPRQVCAVGELRALEYWRPLLRGSLGVALPLAACYLAVGPWIAPTYPRVLLLAGLYGIVFLGSVWSFVLRADERRMAVARLRR